MKASLQNDHSFNPQVLKLQIDRNYLRDGLQIVQLELCYDMLLGTPDHDETHINFWFPPNTPINYISRALNTVCGFIPEINIS